MALFAFNFDGNFLNSDNFFGKLEYRFLAHYTWSKEKMTRHEDDLPKGDAKLIKIRSIKRKHHQQLFILKNQEIFLKTNEGHLYFQEIVVLLEIFDIHTFSCILTLFEGVFYCEYP